MPGLADSTTPLADAAGRFGGAAGAALITVGALISISGTLNGLVSRGPRRDHRDGHRIRVVVRDADVRGADPLIKARAR